MIKSKKSLGIKTIVELELDQSTSKSYINKDGIVSHNCKYCRRFYGDVGEPPKIYRLSTLLGNGTNFGKKTDQWRPVSGATHPNTRTSQIVELKPGWKVLPGGRMTYIGLDKWNDYIQENLVE